MNNIEEITYPGFFTATILEWKQLLLNDKYKDIIIDSVRYLVKDERINVYAFVIMPNHIHLVWKICKPHILENVQRDFLKFTAQQIKLELEKDNPKLLSEFYVGAKDRDFQIWERNPLNSRLGSLELIEQKVNYIYKNPLSGKWKLAKDITDYKYSSAKFYYTDKNEFEFLINYYEAFCE